MRRLQKKYLLRCNESLSNLIKGNGGNNKQLKPYIYLTPMLLVKKKNAHYVYTYMHRREDHTDLHTRTFENVITLHHFTDIYI